MSYSKQIVSCHSGTKHRARNCCSCFRSDAAGRQNAEVPPLQIRCAHVQTHAPRFGRSVPLAGPRSCLNLNTCLSVGCRGARPFLQVTLEKQQPKQGAGGGCLPASHAPYGIASLNFQKSKLLQLFCVFHHPTPLVPTCNVFPEPKAPFFPFLSLRLIFVTIQPALENLD